MPEPQPVTLRTVPAYRYREHLLCPTCAQAAILPITEWHAAFDTFERRDGLKIVLTPV